MGCLGVLLLLNASDGPSAVLWTSVIAALGALLFSRSGIGAAPHTVPTSAMVLRWRGVWLLILVAAATFNSLDDRRLGLYLLETPSISSGSQPRCTASRITSGMMFKAVYASHSEGGSVGDYCSAVLTAQGHAKPTQFNVKILRWVH